ncbi:MAG: poly(A) polymerase [Candidatus Omnitrophota bacterium]|jgi:poly(A) polymerase
MNNPKAKPNKRLLALSVVRTLRSHNYEAYFVGGCVRDMLLKKRAKDYDIATNAYPQDIQKIFKKTIGVGKAFGVMVVLIKGISFEVATFRKDFNYDDGRHPDRIEFSNAKSDCLRRDFTVNGLFYDPVKRQVIDWVSGITDLESRIIRTIGSPKRRFKEDKLRLLRAVRFAAVLDFKIEPQTFKVVQSMHKQVMDVSQERIREELFKLFTSSNPSYGLVLLDQSKVLRAVLPEVESLKKMKYNSADIAFKNYFEEVEAMIGKLKSVNGVLAFACLFYPLALDVVESIGRRLRFSNDDRKAIMECIKAQTQLKDIENAPMAEVKRMIRRPGFDIELELYRLICEVRKSDLAQWRLLKKMKKTFSQLDLDPKPLLNGLDLSKMGVNPGPQMGKLLLKVEEKQLNGELLIRKDAIKWIQSFLEQNNL